jgi:SOS response regulatory protein OraA/RecX
LCAPADSTENSLSLEQTKRKIMDFIAISDRSETQLRQKLAAQTTPQILSEALLWAKKQNWYATPEKIKMDVVNTLNQKNKGTKAINLKLESMGLGQINIEPQIELEKALSAVETKYKTYSFKTLSTKLARKEKARVFGFLSGRGFDDDIVQKVLDTYFKNSSADGDDYDEKF